MGYIHLPPLKPVGQQIHIEAEFEQAELSEIVSRLKAAVQSLTFQPRSTAAGLAKLPYGRSPALQEGKQEVPLSSAPAREDEFSFPRGNNSSSPTDTPALAKPASGTGATREVSSKITAPVSAPSQVSKDLASSTARHTKPLLADANTLTWKEVWTSEAIEHDNTPVTALAYVPATESLMGGSSVGGWLLSASNNLLNLWECYPGRTGNALQVMHSQMTDFEHMDLAADWKNERMLSTCKEKSREYCVSLFSLSRSNNMLAPRHGSKVALPPKNVMKSYKGNPPLKVRWLHEIGGPLTDALAASYDEHLTIYSIAGANHQAKASWPAHNAPVTQIHVSESDVCLYTADAGGEVSKWELRSKPKQATDKYEGLSSEITGLQQISANKLLATSSGGEVTMWDLRCSKQPLLVTRVPDNGGVDVAAFMPDQRMYALASSTGQIYTFEEASNTFRFQEVKQKKKIQNSSKALLWNVRTCQLYSLCGPSIVVYDKNG